MKTSWYRRYICAQGYLLVLFYLRLMSVQSMTSSTLPRFTQEPKSDILRPGSSTILHCEAHPGPARYRWLFNNLPYPPPGYPPSVFSKKATANTLKLTGFGQNPLSGEGGYRCVATTSVGIIVSRDAKLELAVLGPHNTSGNNLKITAPLSSTVHIPCQPPFAKPDAIYEFEFNNSRLTLTDRHEILPSSHLRITNLMRQDSGTYRCLAFNPLLSNRLRSDAITRLTVEEGVINETMWTPVTSLTVVQGKNVTVECSTNWGGNITWEKYGGQLPTSRYNINNGNLLIHLAQKFDSGTYICQAKSSTNEILTGVISLSIIEPPSLEAIPSTHEANKDSTVSLKCKPTNPPIFAKNTQIHWFHNGVQLIQNNTVDIKEYLLVLSNVNIRHSGIYQCYFKNMAGVASVITRLTILPRHGGSVHSADVNDNEDEDDADDDDDDGGDDDYGSAEGDMIDGTDNDHKNTLLKVTILTESSVLIHWTVQPQILSQISNFKLMMKNQDDLDSRWQIVEDHINPKTKSFQLTTMQGRTYKFRLTAYGANRLIIDTKESTKITMPVSPQGGGGYVGATASNIAIVEVRPLTCTEMYLGWQVSDQEAYSAEAFEIFYHPNEDTLDTLTVVVPGSAVRNAVIRGLKPATEYRFRARGLYETEGTTVEGIFSKRVVKETTECDNTIMSDIHLTNKFEMNSENVNRHHSKDGRYVNDDDNNNINNSRESIIYIVIGSILSLLLVMGLISLAACFYHQRTLKKKTGDKGLKGSGDPSAYTLRTCVGDSCQGQGQSFYPCEYPHDSEAGGDRTSAHSGGGTVIIRNGTYLRLPNGEIYKGGTVARMSAGSGEFRLPLSEHQGFNDQNFDTNLYDTVEHMLPAHDESKRSEFSESNGPPNSSTYWSNNYAPPPNFERVPPNNYPTNYSYRLPKKKKVPTATLR